MRGSAAHANSHHDLASRHCSIGWNTTVCVSSSSNVQTDSLAT